MNFYRKNGGTPFLVGKRILAALEQFKAKGLVGDCSVGPLNRYSCISLFLDKYYK